MSETSHNSEHHNTESSEAVETNPVRRRRTGRRVVRGTGAADAHVPMQVEADSSEDESPRRRTRRSQAQNQTPAQDSTHRSAQTDNEEEPQERSRRRASTTRRRSRAESAASSERSGEERSGREADSDDAAQSSESSESSESEGTSTRSRSRRTTASSRTRSGQAGESRRRSRSASAKDEESDERNERNERSNRNDRNDYDDEDRASEEPKRSSRGRRRATAEDDEPRSSQRARSRTRTRASSSERSQEAEVNDSKAEESAVEEPKSTRSGRATRAQAPAKPMTSLLFQEPIIPTRSASAAESEPEDDDESSREEERPSSRKTRTRKTRTASARHTSRRDEREHEREEEREVEDDESSQPRRRRSRRLNAEERQAADEVELIEQDLREENEEEAAEEEAEGSTRRRRRRNEEDEEDSGLTRRRRRRRGAKDAEEEQPARRSRRQQYVDEITDIEGSTRLEAKKQRRRDNRRERSRQTQLVEQDFLARRENVDRLMVVREKEKHTQISVIEDGILVEHYVSDIDEVSAVGNIYLGRVQNVLPSMEAAFVDIGQARNGVLYAGEVNWDTTRLDGQPRRMELAFKSGDPVLVQVTKDPIGHKGARLTSQVTLAGRFLVLVPSGGMTGVSRKLSDKERARLKSIVAKIAPKDMGVIIRTAAEGASEEAIEKDLESLQRQWTQIEAKREEFWHGKRPKLLQGEPDVAIRVVRDIFNDDFNQLMVEGERVYDHIQQYLETMAPDLKDKLERWDPAEHQGKDVFDKWQIDSQLRKGMERQVYLPSGGSLVIDRTEAMTTIDVNTGRFIGKGKSLEETVTRCNLEAAEEIARQLRLRDIGGMVMIDFVDMVLPANRDLVLRRLVECLARDRTKHQVAEVTSLGLVQMTRKRVGQGLVEAFSEECPTCKGRGFILHDEPTVSTKYDDPYAVKGGDPFVKGSKHSHTPAKAPKEPPAPQGSSPDVKAKLAQIAAAAEKAAEDRAEDDDIEEFDQEVLSESGAIDTDVELEESFDTPSDDGDSEDFEGSDEGQEDEASSDVAEEA
nr:Rne/Rng family ribonuclease [Bombiscardovia apis]